MKRILNVILISVMVKQRFDISKSFSSFLKEEILIRLAKFYEYLWDNITKKFPYRHQQ